MNPLADDLLVFVECDELLSVTREDLFMPSHDRLADNEFKHELEKSLEKAIYDCHELGPVDNHRAATSIAQRCQLAA